MQFWNLETQNRRFIGKIKKNTNIRQTSSLQIAFTLDYTLMQDQNFFKIFINLKSVLEDFS